MGRLLLFMCLSQDGFIAGPEGELDWEIRDEKVGRFMIPDLLSTVDTMLIGRVLYQGFEKAWPEVITNPQSPDDLVAFAKWIEDSPKYVFSKTRKHTTWKNSHWVTVANDFDLVTKVKQVKRVSTGDIVVFGGVRFAQTLVRHNLIDEYRFKLQPVVLGNGLPLFTSSTSPTALQLIKSKVFKSGVSCLYYIPKISENKK